MTCRPAKKIQWQLHEGHFKSIWKVSMARRRRGPSLFTALAAVIVCQIFWATPGGPAGPAGPGGRCFSAGRRAAAVAAAVTAIAASAAPARAELSPPLERATKRYGQQIQGATCHVDVASAEYLMSKKYQKVKSS